MTKSYDFYTEPCQLCIERNKQGKHDLIEDCGWCNDIDTHFKSSNDYPGDIVKLPYGGFGYPYHNLPHPERDYFLNDRKISSLSGTIPNEDIPETKEKNSSNAPRFTEDEALSSLLSWFAIVVLLTPILVYTSITSGYNYTFSEIMSNFKFPFELLSSGQYLYGLFLILISLFCNFISYKLLWPSATDMDALSQKMFLQTWFVLIVLLIIPLSRPW